MSANSAAPLQAIVACDPGKAPWARRRGQPPPTPLRADRAFVSSVVPHRRAYCWHFSIIFSCPLTTATEVGTIGLN